MKPPAAFHVLVVEDDPAFQQVLRRRLEIEGYQVSIAADGREGMKAIVETEPQIVLSDWMMPHVDGLELCQSVKTGLGEGAPYFVLITARGEVDDRILALDNGADDYLVKPCEPGEILARVRTGTRVVEAMRELKRLRGEVSWMRAQLASQEAELDRLRGPETTCPNCGESKAA